MKYHRRVTRLLCAIAVLFVGCGPSAVPAKAPPVEAPPPPTSVAPPAKASAPPVAPPLEFIEDDVDAALAKARREHKALLVDAWAPWCHTCLSMKAFVFGDPALRPLAERVVFASIDTDREANAPFLTRHAVHVWPTLFLLSAEDDKVIGYWPGSASSAELRAFVDDALRSVDAAKPEGDPARDLALAQAAYAARDDKKAIDAYARAVTHADPSWPRRSEALVGWVQALRTAKRYDECVAVAEKHLAEVRGAAIPADFSGGLLMCADELPSGSAKEAARTAAIARLREFLAQPPSDASADDVADAWATLSEALAATGDAAGSRKANEARLAVMEKAAASAPSPEAAATFDYGRANAYLALGRGDEAVRMLEAREKEKPEAYEPPARLGSVLAALGRHREAIAAYDRAIARAYGPRKLRYLKQKADVFAKVGDRAAEISVRREEVRGYEALPPGQASAWQLDEARRRLGSLTR